MICGVDEAGKGPVVGPLVVAAVAVNNAKDIANLGIKDSKQLTQRKRKELANLIKEKFNFAVEIIEPKIVDEYRKRNILNELNSEDANNLITNGLLHLLEDYDDEFPAQFNDGKSTCYIPFKNKIIIIENNKCWFQIFKDCLVKNWIDFC